jgi:hypothetical protein
VCLRIEGASLRVGGCGALGGNVELSKFVAPPPPPPLSLTFAFDKFSTLSTSRILPLAHFDGSFQRPAFCLEWLLATVRGDLATKNASNVLPANAPWPRTFSPIVVAAAKPFYHASSPPSPHPY